MLVKLFVMLFVFCVAFTQSARAGDSDWQKEKGMFALFETSMGKIVCRLFPDKAPKTVENFVGLAEGAKEYIDSKTGETKKGNFYDGTIFHRIIPNFMIQGGDPTGTGRGGPGYKFEDEFYKGGVFSKPGILAMANAGPNTNGSQFFITHVPTPWLDNKHTVFGEVVEGQDVVNKMADVPKGRGDKPTTDIVLTHVKIIRNN